MQQWGDLVSEMLVAFLHPGIRVGSRFTRAFIVSGLGPPPNISLQDIQEKQ